MTKQPAKRKPHEPPDKRPIATLTEADGYVLVYGDESLLHATGSYPCVMARLAVDGAIRPMFTTGHYFGAKYWRPIP